MRPSPLLALVVLLLAGCSTPGGSSGGGTTPTTGGTMGPSFTQVAIGPGGPEPVLALTASGVAFIAAQDASGGAPHVWVSSDGGKTFRTSSPTTQGGGEADIAATDDIAYFTELGPGGNIVTHSTDEGASWGTPFTPGTTQYFDREWVALRGSAAFIVARDFQKASAVVSRSTDGGITFLPAGNAWDASHEPGATNGNLLAYEGGLALAYVCRDGNAVCVATSGDDGGTWAQHGVVTRSVAVDNVYPVVAADGHRLVVVWSDASAGDLAIFAARSDDDGASWSAPARVSTTSESATLAWVDARAGRAWVAYASTTDHVANADAAGASVRWSVAVARVDSGSLAVRERSVAFADAVHVGPISHPAGHPGQSGAFDRSFGDFFTLAVDAGGKPWVVVVDTAHGAARDLLARAR